MKTKYRTVSNGHWEFLQYEEVSKFLWFTFKSWKFVYRPYFCSIMGRSDSTGADTHVNSLHTNLDRFVNDYPDVSTYFEWANKEQERLESNVADEKRERDVRASKVRYL